MGDAIVVEGLGKRYYRYHLDRPWTLHEALLRGLRKLRPAEILWGLRDLHLNVAPGRMVGVIGRNGAGKSTLLRLLGGVGRPDEGCLEVKGRIGALLDLGAAFHPDLTGRENVFTGGIVGGLTRREVASRLDSIIAFSELEDYIDSPLRAYSTGMQMRLAFSVAIHTRPEILLIDEVLAVGDVSFQRKCLDRIRHFRSEGCTIILVSHEVAMIRELCDEALWLRAGQRVAYGTAESVVDEYLADVDTDRRQHTPEDSVRSSTGAEMVPNEDRSSLEVAITSARVLNSLGAPTAEIDSGDPLSVEIIFETSQRVDPPNFQVYIHRADGIVCCDLATQVSAPDCAEGKGRGRILLHLERVDLNGGLYYIDVAAYKKDWSRSYDYHYKVHPLVVRPTGVKEGLLRPAHHWEVKYFQTDESDGTPIKVPSVYV